MDDVLVVGAGYSGLAAASAAVDAELSVTVLEARDRVGGRSRNERFSDGTLIESGGQWVGPMQDAALALAAEHCVERYPTPEDGEHVSRFGGRNHTFRGDTFALPPRVLMEALLVQKRLERMAASVPLHAPWTAADASRLDGQTFESWLRRNVVQKQTRDFFRFLSSSLFSAESSQVSLLHWLFYVGSAGGLDALMATDGGAQMWRLVGGTQGLAEKMAAPLGDRVRLEQPVRAVRQDAEGVEVTTLSGSTHRARRLVMAVPPHLLAGIHFTPHLPARRAQLIQSVPMGSVIKIHLRYPSRFWRAAGRSGFAVNLDHPVSITFDNTPQGAKGGVLLAFIEGAHAKHAATLDDQARRSLIVGGVTQLHGPEAASPLEVHERDWAAERWSGGCYGGHLGPGVWTQLGSELRVPHGRVHWAGTETADRWNGYLDGALTAGRRAAREAVQAERRATRATT